MDKKRDRMMDHHPEPIGSDDNEFFGRWLRHRRRSLDLTQEALAQRVGCVVDTVRKIEGGVRRPSRALAERLAQCLSIPLEQRPGFLAAARAGRAPHELDGFSIPPPGAAPTLVSIAPRSGHLPSPLTSFIGREWEVATVGSRLRMPEVRLVTLTGTGGIGKTRLALQIASGLHDAFPQGVWFVNLAPLGDPTLVIPTLAQTLGVRQQHGIPIVETLRAALREQRLLVVLDNFEQVVAAAPALAGLLADLPGLKALVTSREVLRLSGEHVVVVAPLAVPEAAAVLPATELMQYAAVRLFAERAQAVAEHFRLSDANAAAVAMICARLDGLPLAIELAAARLPLFPPATLLARLERRLPLLTRGPRDLPERQQTLRNTIDWSYQLLSADEQQMFRCLAVFVGGCTIAAAETICGARGNSAGDVLEGAASLIDKSLLRQIDQKHDEPRLAMLETIREYALEQLEECRERHIVQDQHAAYYLALVEMAEPRLHGPEQSIWLERLDAEHDNLRAVLARKPPTAGSSETRLRLAAGLWWFWMVRGHIREGREWLIEILAQAHMSTLARAKVLLGWGYLERMLGNLTVARSAFEESLAVSRSLGDEQGVAIALVDLGSMIGLLGDVTRANQLFEESRTLLLKQGDRSGLAWLLFNRGFIQEEQGGYTQAEILCQQSLALYRELGDEWGTARALLRLGKLAHEQGDYAHAAGCFLESLRLHQRLGDVWGVAYTHTMLGHIVREHNDAIEVTERFTEGLMLSRRTGEQPSNASSPTNQLDSAGIQGNDAQAATHYHESLILFRELGNKIYLSPLLRSLGYIELNQSGEQAAAYFQESLALAQELGQRQDVALNLVALAVVAVLRGQPERAIRLLVAAEMLCESLGFQLNVTDRANFDRILAAAHTQLDDSTNAGARAAGQRMALEQAIAEALNTSPPDPAHSHPSTIM